MNKVLCLVLFAGLWSNLYAQGEGHVTKHSSHHSMSHGMDDARIPLGLTPQMKQHQLANMRAHLEAVQAIVGLMGAGDFDKASEIAYARLGLTEEMRRMCSQFTEDYTAIGMAFHNSGDTLGNALQSEDMQKSLEALNTTLGYCTQCHATFRH